MKPQTQTPTPTKQQGKQEQSVANMKKSLSRNSESSAPMDSPHSPTRFHTPLRSDPGDLPETPPYHSPENFPDKPTDNSKAIIAIDKYTKHSPHVSMIQDQQQKQLENVNSQVKTSTPMFFNRREEAPPSITKVGPVARGNGGEDGGRRRFRFSPSTGRSPRKEDMVSKAALGFRVSEFILCLISFSVMAADRTQGWAGDSFDRYKEYRYCLSVNVIAFVYSGFQAYDLTYHLVTGKHVIHHHLRHHFGFFMDQVLAYLLISASSSAATRVDDWQSNWGKDEFTEMASASVAMSFLAFIAFAISSLISGYHLCTND